MKIKVTVHPNSKEDKLINKDGHKHLYLKAAAIESKANQAAIKILAKSLGIKKNQIFLVSGTKSKEKVFEIIN
jgi:uncharacterized protein YggU (UPF0235/DUF167 family)